MDSKCHFRRLAFTLTTGVILAAGAVITGGTTALASGTAAQPSPSPHASTGAAVYCQDFLAHLSTAVGVGQVRLQTALTRAARQTVADALARHDINNKQASTINSQLSAGSVCTAHGGMSGMRSGAHGTAYCQDFVGHLSRTVGIGEPQVQSALVTAARETVGDAVTRGDLTSQQASSIDSQLASGSICNVTATAGMKRAVSQTLATAIATALGTTPEQVRTQLDQGKSVSAIAPAGMTEQQFATAFEKALRTQLDARVKAGTLTQSQENQLLASAPALANRLWVHGTQIPSPQATGTPSTAAPVTSSPAAPGTSSPAAPATSPPSAAPATSPSGP